MARIQRFALPWLLAACNPTVPVDPPPVDAGVALRRMADCTELRDQITDVTLESMVQGGYYWGPEVDVAQDDGDGGGGPTDFTTTNVQEAGVDELDLVKTNGTHLFIAQDRGVHLLKSWPVEETEQLASISLEGWSPGLFLIDDQLVVFEQVWSWYGAVDEGLDFTDRDGLRVHTYDITDPAAPVLTHTVELEGYLTDARMIDGTVHMVMQQWLDLPYEVWELMWNGTVDIPEVDWSATEAEQEMQREAARVALRPHVAQIVADTPLIDLLPLYRPAAGDDVSMLLACDDVYAPPNLSPAGMMTVVSLDPSDGSVGATGLMADGWTVYASLDNLYVAQSSRWWWGYENEGLSHVHKFAIGGDEPVYVASGEVKGWTYDQFAMSEHDGFLRVATTDFIDWWDWDGDRDEAANNLFVLEDDGDGELVKVGEVTGLAPGEQIQAARLMGDKGYIVTFRQTDPLFTLDLSDPTNPTVEGELHMPGFSAYLHPVGDDHLLGVGMAGLETGELTGLAVNIFDVSDLSNPTLTSQHEVDGDGWAWSEALWDHHAFTYHRDVLTIPAYTDNYDPDTGDWQWFSGTISFDATTDGGIREIGRVDHRDLVDESECLYSWWWEWEDAVCNGDYWYANVRRSVYIEDNLFTISDYGVKVNDLNDPSVEIASVPFYPLGG